VTAAEWSLGVLAGGQSTRMGSDKASRAFGGGTLLSHVARRFGPPGAAVTVSTRSPEVALPAGAARVLDAEPGLGPLAGIAALLARAPTPWLLVVPVDLPLLPPECGRVLASASDDCDAVVFSWKGRVEPFPALVSRRLAPLIADLLRRGLRRADSFHGEAPCRVLAFEDVFQGRDPAVAFLNVNTPEDLARAERLAASEPR
jgi:molybdopterin-guanine dinucleotide biosynthesis protein A